MTIAGFRARLLGDLDLRVDERPVIAAAFERPSGLRVLKLLLVSPGHRLRREEAAELLWPDADPRRSGANLRKAIHFARRGLEATSAGADGIIGSDGTAIWLDPESVVSIDVDELTSAIESIEAEAMTIRSGVAGDAADGEVPTGDRLSEAMGILVRLAGEELLPADPYESWLAPLRERLRGRALDALLAGAAVARGRGDRPRASALVERALRLEPADERAHRVAIELHLDAGELHAARRQLQACRQAVAEAYGLEPDPALARRIDEVAARRARAVELGPAEAPILGRRRELDAASRAFDAAAAGGSAALLLRGPAGIGKSRILRELGGLARASGWPVLELRGLEDAPGQAFAAVAEAILVSLGGRLPPTFAEPSRSAVLSASPDRADEPTVTLASDTALLGGLLDAIGSLAGAAGRVTILADDAQWLDPASLGLLEAVADGRGRCPTLVLATIRDDPDVMGGSVRRLVEAIDRAGATVAVGPLAADEIRLFVERDVALGPLDPTLAASIAELSAGTPLYAAELFRSARESGLVELREGEWRFRAGVDALQVPDGIARLVERRISRMGPVARIVLATAAELGDVVAFEDLIATASRPEDVLDIVDAAMAAGIIREDDGRYAFGHPLYRAALRRGLPPRDRAAVHRRIALALAAGLDPRDTVAMRRAGARDTDLVAIADHAATATELGSLEMAPLAVGLGIAAGERQGYLFDFAGAVATLRRSIRLWQRLPAEDGAGFPISNAYVELGQGLRRTGDDPGAEAAFAAAIETATHDDALATAASAAAWLPYEHGRYGPALAILGTAASRIADPVARARIDSARGWIVGRTGDWTEAAAILHPAVEALEKAGPTADLMRALDRLAIAYRDAGQPTASIPILERAIHLAVELGRTGERAAYEMHLAGALRDLGRLDDAVDALERARSLSRRAGERYVESVVEWISAEVEQTRGDDATAIDHRRRELAIFGEIGGNPRHEALAHAHIAHLARRLGNADLERSEAEVARVGARHSGVEGLEARVEWALATPDWFAPQPGGMS